jgi:hypothetical protein
MLPTTPETASRSFKTSTRDTRRAAAGNENVATQLMGRHRVHLKTSNNASVSHSQEIALIPVFLELEGEQLAILKLKV